MTDRLALIKARHAEAGGGDGDVAWLIAEVVRERRHVLWVERRCWRTITLLEAIGHLEARIEAAEEERNAAEAEVERLRGKIQTALIHHDKGDIEDVASVLDEALNSGRGVYKP